MKIKSMMFTTHVHVVRVALFVLAVCCGSSLAATEPGSVTLDRATLTRAFQLSPGATLDVAAFPVGPGIVAPVHLERIDVYSTDAKIFLIDANGQREVPRSSRVHFLGSSDADSSIRFALSIDPSGASAATGAGSSANGPFVLLGEKNGTGLRFRAMTPEATFPAGVTPQVIPGNDAIAAPASLSNPLSALSDSLLASPQPAASALARLATIGVDTDSSFMSLRFSNDTAAATSWISDLITVMNVMYRRDLNVVLVQGTTFLRVGSDPYPTTGSPVSNAQLIEFGNNWQNNYSSGVNAVSRTHAMLLSGKSSSGNSASGRAWINSYCATAGSGGSYSVNQIFTNSGIPVDLTARVIGHELGHNFGASHNHCTNASDGTAPVATGTIDQCFNMEGGCYAGASTSCPSSGPGAPNGALMSYCNINGCGQNVLQFHPTQITKLLARIASNTPSCLKSEVVLVDGFN